MLSCLGFRRRHDAEREPLLPKYNDDTALQIRLHEKLHTYQMLRALSKGYMPSNKQAITHLRSLLSADVLNPDASDLSDSGRALVRDIKLWLRQLIELLLNKNPEDQVQDFIWCLAKARLQVDTDDIGTRASQARADTSAVYQSLQTVGSLLLTNPDFRVLLSDLETITREVFRDTAFTLFATSRQAGEQLELSGPERQNLQHANGDSQPTPSKHDLQEDIQAAGKVLSEGASNVAREAEHSVIEHVTGDEEELAYRLKQVVTNLRKRPDCSDSVSALAMLLQRYLLAYSRATRDAADALEEDVTLNPQADQALHNFWLLVTSIGDRAEWKRVEVSLRSVVEHRKNDPNFDELIRQLANAVQDMLSEPDFFDNINERFNEIRETSRSLASRSTISDDLDALFSDLHSALQSVTQDADIHRLLRTSSRVANLLSPAGAYTNDELLGDSINVFVPMAIQTVQYIPLPRLEVVTPGMDLLVENLVLEPGRTVNQSSFLPFKLNVSTWNNIEVRKARTGTTSTMEFLTTIKASGLSIAAEDMGFWLRLHSGLLRMMGEGMANFYLDERGLDISLDLEIGRDSLEKIIALRDVNVDIHHLNYSLSKSRFACIAWVLKPLIRPIVRKALEAKIAGAIDDGLRTLNRELLFARERLRAARIADPGDFWTLLKAVAARPTSAPDPDVDTRLGVWPGGGVFRDRYAPGSLVRLWESEGRAADHQVGEYKRGGWRNEIFSLQTARCG